MTPDQQALTWTLGSGVGLVFGALNVVGRVKDRRAARKDRVLFALARQELETESIRGLVQFLHLAAGLSIVLALSASVAGPATLALVFSPWILAFGSAYAWWTRRLRRQRKE